MTIKIYTEQITPRLQYACNIVFKTILKVDYELVDEVRDAAEITINYSPEKLEGVFQVKPSGMLEQKGIASHDLLPGEYMDLKTLFHSGEGSIPFDIFSAVFYMCSKYEEYLPFDSDEHGRYKVENSLAYRYGFLEEPIVELWVQLLASQLKIEFPNNSFQTLLTIDVDDAWKYKNRSIFLIKAKLLKSLLSLKFKEFGSQIAVLFNKKDDPWYTFPYLAKLEERLKLSIQYFILIGGNSKYDKSISIKKKAFRELIRQLQEKNKVGIHPSYASNYSKKLLHKEFFALSGVSVRKPSQSRQHYLMLKFPETLRNMQKLGILEEHSLGWAGNIGFRAGISRPFPFYDLLAEKESHMQLVPFMIMDRTLKDYMHLSPAESIIRLKELIDKVKVVGGQFTMLWHNDSVSNTGEWEDWRTVFEQVLEYARSEDDKA